MHHGENAIKISAVALLTTLRDKGLNSLYGVKFCADSQNINLTDPTQDVLVILARTNHYGTVNFGQRSLFCVNMCPDARKSGQIDPINNDMVILGHFLATIIQYWQNFCQNQLMSRFRHPNLISKCVSISAQTILLNEFK